MQRPGDKRKGGGGDEHGVFKFYHLLPGNLDNI